MTRYRRAFITAALILALVDLTLITLIALRLHWLTRAATPQGKATITWVFFALLFVVLCALWMRDGLRQRASREAQEWDALDEWEQQMYAEMGPWLDGDVAVRSITRADKDQAAAALPEPVPRWGQRLTPLEMDYALSYTGPSRLRSRPMAEIDTYIGDAAWTAEAFRSGAPVVDEVYEGATRVLRSLSPYIDAPVSPAPGLPREHRPRHAAEDLTTRAHPIGYDRVAARVLNEATGALPIVRTSKVLVSV